MANRHRLSSVAPSKRLRKVTTPTGSLTKRPLENRGNRVVFEQGAGQSSPDSRPSFVMTSVTVKPARLNGLS